MVNYGKQSLDQSDIDAVVEALKSDWITQGPVVEVFENSLCSYFGASRACAVANGTAALHLTALALGWQTRDVVVTTPVTFVATANCIVYTGATPDFVDIDPITYTIDPNRVEEKVKSLRLKGEQIKAIIGVDYAGHPCDWKALRDIADQYELQLVSDNCHALGASYNRDKQYAVKYADVVTQSYHPVKHITTGEGGAVLTNDSSIDEKVRLLRTHGIWKGSSESKNQKSILSQSWYYEMHELGYNYRITDFQCALGSSQLKKLDRFVGARRKIASLYDQMFAGVDFLTIPRSQRPIRHAYHLYPLQVDFEKAGINKSLVFGKMNAAGVNLQVHYIPVHLQPYYRREYGFKRGDYPVSETFYEREISLPMFPGVTDEVQKTVVSQIKESLCV